MTAHETGLIDWPSLMRAGLGGLRLSPGAFWSLTPRELAAILGSSAAIAPMTRDRLQSLVRQFPDTCAGDENP